MHGQGGCNQAWWSGELPRELTYCGPELCLEAHQAPADPDRQPQRSRKSHRSPTLFSGCPGDSAFGPLSPQAWPQCLGSDPSAPPTVDIDTDLDPRGL